MGRFVETEPESVPDGDVLEEQLRALWLGMTTWDYRDPKTAGGSSPSVVATTPARRASRAMFVAYGKEWNRLRRAGYSPAGQLAALREWLDARRDELDVIRRDLAGEA